MQTKEELIKLSYDHPIMFFDGDCVFCSEVFKSMIHWDKEEKYRFGTLQSPACNALRNELNIEEDLDSVLLLVNGQMKIKSDVGIHMLNVMPWYYFPFQLIKLFPKSLRDWAYDVFARLRYRLFGQEEQCIIPTPEIKQRFV